MTRALGPARVIGAALLLGLVLMAVGAPGIAPNDPAVHWPDRAFAPPSRIHVRDAQGWHSPFIYRSVLTNRMLREYREDLSARVPLEFFSRGRIVTTNAGAEPLMLLGGDALGRDLFARFVSGARLSFGVTALGLLGALGIGTLVGAWAGSAGGATERWLMRAADFVLVLPGTYLVLVIRGVLPLVLSTWQVFGLMAAIFAFSAWPHVARGVRAIVAAERARPYAEAARAAGAGPFRLAAHLLPAARGFLLVEIVLLAPALLIAEVTISFLGLGFPIPVASWGMLLQDAQNVQALASAPWLLAPALGLFVVALALNLVSGTSAESAIVTGTSASPSSSLTAAQSAR